MNWRESKYLDKDGYPTDEALKKIEGWRMEDGIRAFLDFLGEIWTLTDIIIRGKKVFYVELHTGGWSGNESIIDSLQKSYFWFFFWEKSVRGGHYYFKTKEYFEENKVK